MTALLVGDDLEICEMLEDYFLKLTGELSFVSVFLILNGVERRNAF